MYLKHHTTLRPVLALAFLFPLTACLSTAIKSVQRDADFQSARIHKVLIVSTSSGSGFSTDEGGVMERIQKGLQRKKTASEADLASGDF